MTFSRFRPLAPLLANAVLAAGLHGPAVAQDIALGYFSKAAPGGELPAGWRRYVLGKPEHLTEYSLVSVEGRTVLKAEANASVSALVFPVRADPLQTPWLIWSWRVDNLLQKGDILTKEGDDYPARVYVLFDYDVAKLPFGERTKIRLARLVYGDPIPVAALCYVWDNKQAPGFTTWSAYTGRLRMIVTDSGAAHLRQWRRVQRNVAEDFRQAFGEEAPAITAVIVAADTDNTRESARAWFGDISLRGAPADEK
jgi:hypothetical protein